MKILLLTTSPFQLMNALIYSADDESKSYTLMLDESFYGEIELKQIDYLCRLFNVVTVKLKNKGWLGHYREIRAMARKGFDFLIIGPDNHWSGFMAAFIPIFKVVVVDDGAHALSSFPIAKGKLLFKTLILKMLFDIFDLFLSKKDVERFSLFGLPSKFRVISPDYKKLKTLTRTHELDFSFEEKSLLFVGTPISEAEVISLDTEVAAIYEMFKSFSEYKAASLRKFIYVAHRSDSMEKLTKLESHGITVARLAGPLELYLAESLGKPDITICSLTSTVLFTAHNLGFSKENIVAVELQENLFLKQYEEKYARIYQSFIEQGFKIFAYKRSKETISSRA